MLFAKQGMSEKLLLKLQALTGVCTREEIEQTTQLWIKQIFDEYQGTKDIAATANKPARKSKAKAVAA